MAGGADRTRRSHRFLADKDRATLEHALHASLDLVEGRKARLRIVNDRVGHFFPSGGNWVFVRLSARDPIGRTRAEKFVGIGREEALTLDFWPFASDRQLGVDESRDIVLDLPEGHGTIEADVRYHDFMRANRAGDLHQGVLGDCPSKGVGRAPGGCEAQIRREEAGDAGASSPTSNVACTRNTTRPLAWTGS